MKLEIVPLGGLGEFGMNCMLYRHGDDAVLVDCGMMFPRAEHLGVDVVIPDLSALHDGFRIHGVILTHGHEDHIGALPYLLARHALPVHGTPYTLGLARRRLAEHALEAAELCPLPDDGPLALGPFGIETIRVAHSVPQSRMLVLHTPAGRVVHTADFKLDLEAPPGERTDLATLARLGRDGVLALLSDSTNADRPGVTPGERGVARALERAVAAAPRRVVVTTFSSHVRRLAALAAIARRHGRKLALVGASIEGHAEVAAAAGLLDVAPDVRVPPERIADLPPHQVLIVAGGSQGEPGSSMARIAAGEHRDIELGEGDLVIHSARAIPDHVGAIQRMTNRLLRRGVEVLEPSAAAPVHVSGHAARDELRLVLDLLRPRHFVPLHGEYRQLHAHAALAREAGLDGSRVLLAETGDVIAVDERGIEVAGRVPVGQVCIDAILDTVDAAVLRERRRIAGDGIVVPVVAVDRASGTLSGAPRILTRGFVPSVLTGNGLLHEAQRTIATALGAASAQERGDPELLRARVQTELKRFLRRRTQRRPLILPVIVEL